MNRIRKFYLLVTEIGLPSLVALLVYRFKIKTGVINSSSLIKRANSKLIEFDIYRLLPPDQFNFSFGSDKLTDTFQSADEIVDGMFHPFGGQIEPLDFSLLQPLLDWTKYTDVVGDRDIKFLWEPARFGWALPLARAFAIASKETYAEAFWKLTEELIAANPAYLGPNWVSAQEVALTAMNWLLVLPILKSAKCTTPARLKTIVNSLWQHFIRIQPSLTYAKSQNNNHLLSEALGLYMLGSFFAPQSSSAARWKLQGAALFENTLLQQIEPDGTYVQHSTNYHRMMLQLSLIYNTLIQSAGKSLPQPVMERLAAATRWMEDQMAPASGELPNLGHNDGTLLIPFGCQNYNDYRPTLQAANRAFVGQEALPSGKWDELSAWLNLPAGKPVETSLSTTSPAIHKVGTHEMWATLRAVQFHGRPAHADQLHVDLWWDGYNIARDAGTFSYNASSPWQNALASTRVHNTITIDQADQMVRAGKFLWLGRANASWLSAQTENTISASHNGYAHLGAHHTRTLTYLRDNGFSVEDQIDLKNPPVPHEITLHWLLPDWQWNWKKGILTLTHDNHQIELGIRCNLLASTTEVPLDSVHLVRAGIDLMGGKNDEIMGWVSPTYNMKIPTLSLSLSWISTQSITINSDWKLRKDS